MTMIYYIKIIFFIYDLICTLERTFENAISVSVIYSFYETVS